MNTQTRPPSSASPSLAAWQARAVHTISCPSGQRLRIRVPGIATLLEHGDLSDDLFDIATAEITDTIATDGIEGPVVISGAVQWTSKAEEREEKLERIRIFGRFQRELVCAAIVGIETKPEEWHEATLSPEDLDSLPEDDLALVAEIVQRLRFKDAKGVRIGVEPLDRWATFRQEHKDIACTGGEDCPGCARVVAAFSSLDLDEV